LDGVVFVPLRLAPRIEFHAPDRSIRKLRLHQPAQRVVEEDRRHPPVDQVVLVLVRRRRAEKGLVLLDDVFLVVEDRPPCPHPALVDPTEDEVPSSSRSSCPSGPRNRASPGCACSLRITSFPKPLV